MTIPLMFTLDLSKLVQEEDALDDFFFCPVCFFYLPLLETPYVVVGVFILLAINYNKSSKI